ncbi:hypothetical protein ABL78_0015 [Leptomonas seymouri]|uniref:Uncharacterized protein n=1 Tax=Leptomonas seymouri TaxID=5684 RepID=A0A0N1IMN5_LEPSE|nr:hypothetical protein ABL78_0015 [Leptomonas seymouri]|eukprot:KPI90782.1 hypothetical protein ABL78_0015 [Leptomonas seymouri]
MKSLIEEAEEEYERLRQDDKTHTAIRLHTASYDFLTAESPTIVPIHIIEARRQEERRHGVIDASATPLDFLKSIGVDPSDTRDPTNNFSILQVEESTRAYYGNLESDTYRAYRMQMFRFTDDMQWLKGQTFMKGQMVFDEGRLRPIESRCGLPEHEPMKPITGFKEAFYQRKPNKQPAEPEAI